MKYETETEYRKHFERIYCRGKVLTFDEIRVYFQANKFDHAFYESSARDGKKDRFSFARARRIDWIKATLEASDANIYQGWDKQKKRYDPGRRVCTVYEDFVVIIEIRQKKYGELKGNFVTCYKADNSIDKIRMSPVWTEKTCRDELKKKGR
ncbi:MAG: hypothetical protein MRK02_00190 [Candidatus Scalindua sp.]|nr:hypothetical protein [Candidatus Scalindua sp.]